MDFLIQRPVFVERERECMHVCTHVRVCGGPYMCMDMCTLVCVCMCLCVCMDRCARLKYQDTKFSCESEEAVC